MNRALKESWFYQETVSITAYGKRSIIWYTSAILLKTLLCDLSFFFSKTWPLVKLELRHVNYTTYINVKWQKEKTDLLKVSKPVLDQLFFSIKANSFKNLNLFVIKIKPSIMKTYQVCYFSSSAKHVFKKIENRSSRCIIIYSLLSHSKPKSAFIFRWEYVFIIANYERNNPLKGRYSKQILP